MKKIAKEKNIRDFLKKCSLSAVPFLIGISFLVWNQISFAQQSNYTVSINISVEKKLVESFKEKGRLFIFMSSDSIREPRTQTWPNPMSKTNLFAINIDDFDPKETVKLTGDDGWIGTPEWTLNNVPSGEYYIQIVWDQNSDESRINEPGNIYSEKIRIDINQSKNLSFIFNQKV